MRVTASVLLACGLLVVSGPSSSALPTSASIEASAVKREDALHLPIRKRELRARSGSDLLEWAYSHKAHLQNKYHIAKTADDSSDVASHSSSSARRKRASGVSLTNVQYDSSWVAAISGGTPSRTYEVVLDTGSADLWLSSAYYQPSTSSSFRNASTAFDISYGSGEVTGYMATDDFSLGGITVDNLNFAVATSVSSGLTSSNMEGIMGMGFTKLASSGKPPFWVAANQDTFSFYLQRASLTSANELQSGGTFTLGGTNASLYQGEINYNDLIEDLYWMLQLGGASTYNSSVSLGGLDRAAIDTGTTLIGGPDSVIQELYANIPGSQSQGNGYYSYPCSTAVSPTLTFGSQQYTLADSDFVAGTLDRSGTTCLGAFFGVGSTSSSDLQWIVGDAFLKNVYTVFTVANGTNARVGFASLASGLNSGTSSTTVSSTTTSSSSPASARFPVPTPVLAVAATLAAALLLSPLL